jgi:demethylmenaquinone methyltransferase/2-methoxy-6-polyprenyl-1,4-benzoquinol methylase
VPRKNQLLKLDQVKFREADNKRAFNLRLFDEVAPAYDRVTAWLSFGQDAVWKRLLVRTLPEIPRPAILDLACGTGDIALALTARFPAGRVVGLDLNPTMLACARNRPGIERVSLQLGDMNHTGFKAHEFDIITGGYALRNAPDLKSTLAEIHRVLKPGGRCAFLDFSKSPQWFVQKLSLGLLKFWGGLWGFVMHGNPDIYAYLAESLRHFPDRVQLRRMLAAAGFRNIASQVLFFGFIELVVFEK